MNNIRSFSLLFPSPKYRSYEDSVKNISLTLINDYFAEGYARPLVPASVEIRGIQVNENSKDLPKGIQHFLDSATQGAIFFSFGTNVNKNLISEEKFKIFLKVFGKLKQKVIMKWDDEIQDQPENVFVSKWLPQTDILAHPNIKLFISHCGLGGLVESKFLGIPVLAFPLFADQFTNARDVVKEGRAIELDLATLNDKILFDSINEMLENGT